MSAWATRAATRFTSLAARSWEPNSSCTQSNRLERYLGNGVEKVQTGRAIQHGSANTYCCTVKPPLYLAYSFPRGHFRLPSSFGCGRNSSPSCAKKPSGRYIAWVLAVRPHAVPLHRACRPHSRVSQSHKGNMHKLGTHRRITSVNRLSACPWMSNNRGRNSLCLPPNLRSQLSKIDANRKASYQHNTNLSTIERTASATAGTKQTVKPSAHQRACNCVSTCMIPVVASLAVGTGDRCLLRRERSVRINISPVEPRDNSSRVPPARQSAQLANYCHC